MTGAHPPPPTPVQYQLTGIRAPGAGEHSAVQLATAESD
jgi:hypothetical protein